MSFFDSLNSLFSPQDLIMLRDGFDILLPKVSPSCLPANTPSRAVCDWVCENGVVQLVSSSLQAAAVSKQSSHVENWLFFSAVFCPFQCRKSCKYSLKASAYCFHSWLEWSTDWQTLQRNMPTCQHLDSRTISESAHNNWRGVGEGWGGGGGVGLDESRLFLFFYFFIS